MDHNPLYVVVYENQLFPDRIIEFTAENAEFAEKGFKLPLLRRGLGGFLLLLL